MKSLESYESTLKTSMDQQSTTLRRILLIDDYNNRANDSVDVDKILAVETLNLQARSNTTRSLCALLSAYRFADIVALVENRQNVIEVPHHAKERILGTVFHKVCQYDIYHKRCSHVIYYYFQAMV